MRRTAKNIFSRIITASALLALLCQALPPVKSASACFSIVVGKDASADGYVIMAHNEDDSPPQVIIHHKILRRKHNPGEKVKLIAGGELDQVPQTWSYIWSQMPGMLFSDSYVNEWGVAIASDACPSREDQPDLTEGGITYMLRRLLAERARTAREAVQLAGRLVERFGYGSSGRTYVICDPNEGWLFCAVNGKQWLAERVPDDQVAIIANTYTVHRIDLGDTTNFLASSDIIEHAVSRGWYDPASGQAFDFAAAYAHPRVAADSSNFCRQWSGLRHLTAKGLPLQKQLPFSVKPDHKLGVADLMAILRDHYEGTDLYRTSSPAENPHEAGISSICNKNTQTSFIVQLRANLPLDIGIVYWLCLAAPCTSFYIPVHFGSFAYSSSDEFPSQAAQPEVQPSADIYWERVRAPFQPEARQPFWTFSNFSYHLERKYGEFRGRLAAKRAQIEKSALILQTALEDAAIKKYQEDEKSALRLLAEDCTAAAYREALRAMESVLAVK